MARGERGVRGAADLGKQGDQLESSRCDAFFGERSLCGSVEHAGRRGCARSRQLW